VGQNIGEAESYNFPTDSCKFPTEDITGARNSNFARNFSQNGKFLAPFLYFWTKIFGQEESFPDRLKFRGGGNCCSPLPLGIGYSIVRTLISDDVQLLSLDADSLDLCANSDDELGDAAAAADDRGEGPPPNAV